MKTIPKSVSSVFGLLLLFILSACDPKPDNSTVPNKSSSTPRPSAVSSEIQAKLSDNGFTEREFSDGKRYYERYCILCHKGPSADKGMGARRRLAPTPYEVAYAYSRGYPSIQGRVDAIVQFTLKPDPAKAQMPKAIQQYGIMRAVQLPEDQLRTIAIYMTVAAFERPEGFEE